MADLVLTRCEGTDRDWGKWHAIFETAEGKDYCREDLPYAADATQAEAMARKLFIRTADHFARGAVTGFRLEKW